MDRQPVVKRFDGYSELVAGFITGGVIATGFWFLFTELLDCWLRVDIRSALYRIFATGAATVLGTTVTTTAPLVSQWTAPQLDIIRLHRRRKFTTLRALRSTILLMASLGLLSVVGIIVDTGSTRTVWFESLFIVVACSSAGALITTIRVIYEIIGAMLYAEDPAPNRPMSMAEGIDEIEDADAARKNPRSP